MVARRRGELCLLQNGEHSEKSLIKERCIRWLAVYLYWPVFMPLSKLMSLVGWFLKASVPSSSDLLYPLLPTKEEGETGNTS